VPSTSTWVTGRPSIGQATPRHLWQTNSGSATNLPVRPLHFTRPHCEFVCGRHDTAWQPRSRNTQDWHLGCLEATGWAQKCLVFLDAAVQLLHMQGALCRCTVLLEYKVCYFQTLCVLLAWRHYAAQKKTVRDITRISCFVTIMKLPVYITACIADLFNSFVKQCMWLHFSR